MGTIKEVFGWILLLIGSGGTGFVFGSLLILPDFDIVIAPIIFLSIFGVLYIGWKILRKPFPESNKKLIAIIVIIVLLSTVYHTNSLYDSYHYELPELPKIQNESIKAPMPIPVYYNYERYGFSFEYPSDMNISEEGYMSDKPDENSGGVDVTNDKGTKSIYISWLTTTEPELLYPLKDTLRWHCGYCTRLHILYE